jgi:general secretion pathway protein E
MKINESPSDSPGAGIVEELRDLAEQYGMAFLTTVPDDALDPSLVSELPVEWARSNGLLPIRLDGETCLLTSDPGAVDKQEYVALLLGIDLRPVLAPGDIIAQCIERCYYSKDDSPGEFIKDIEDAAEDGVAIGPRSDDLLRVATEAPVTQLVNLILLEAVKRGASDIHFEPFESKLRVRYRIDGIMYEQASPPKHMEEALVSRLKVMAHADIAEKRLPQDGMAKVRVGEREIDIRFSTVPVAEGERVVLRLLDKKSVLLPLTSLGMSGGTLEGMGALLSAANGMIVVSGPTGSGKTTTLYAALSHLDASRQNVLTIEDPIEYQLDDIGQIQVKPKIGLTFANGLRHILRQDPDIILVGETRDPETAEIAVRASLTGHLVLTTLHTNDAAGTVVRLLDMGIEPFLLASCLRGTLAQRLVRRLCPVCRESVKLDSEDVAGLGEKGVALVGHESWNEVGCPECLEGFKGRMGLFELLSVDTDMQSIIRDGHGAGDALRVLVRERGGTTLLDDGVAKVMGGGTSLSEVMNVVSA